MPGIWNYLHTDSMVVSRISDEGYFGTDPLNNVISIIPTTDLDLETDPGSWKGVIISQKSPSWVE